MILAIDGFGPLGGWLAFAVVLVIIFAAGGLAVVQRAADTKRRTSRDR